MSSSNFVMALDTSDASGGDDISLLLADIVDGGTICAGNYNETNLITFAEWICDWIVKYDNLTVIIERKSSGVAIIDYLLLMLPAKGIDPFKRLFNMAVQKGDEDKETWRDLNIPFGRRPSHVYTTNKKTFGFITTGSGLTSRSELYSTTLQLAAKQGGNLVRDKTTIDQITSLLIINNRVDHLKGMHDDMVIAWLLIFWFLTKATNLSFYGIDSKKIFSASNKNKVTTQAEYDFLMEQNYIRQEIVAIEEELSKTNDDFIILKLEQKLRSLNRSIVLEEGEVFSVDELINNVRESKRANRVAKHNTQNYSNYRQRY
jgi:hypothetical protein